MKENPLDHLKLRIGCIKKNRIRKLSQKEKNLQSIYEWLDGFYT
jgi:hypothetical protein